MHESAPPDTGEVPIGSSEREIEGREAVSTPPASLTKERDPDPEDSFVQERTMALRSDAAPSFLDGLFGALVGVDLDTSLPTAVDSLLGAFAESFEDVSVGVCVASGGSTHGANERAAQEVVIRRSPRHDGARAADPTRLFGELRDEWIVQVGAGSTLHAAAHDRDVLTRARPAIERLSMALRFLIERAVAVQRLETTRRESEELRLQIIQSEKLASLGQIAAGIVHELNNPLTLDPRPYSDYLRRDWEKRQVNPADTERLRRINEAAERILAFTRDLISYSRPTASVPGPVDVVEVLERALLFCEHVITTNSVVVERTLDPVRRVTGVSGQLTQVFVNLVTNACQAMKTTGGSLVVSTAMISDGDVVVIRVSDEGHGISDEHKARLFEPYFTTKSDGSGTGLGLPIVLNIIKSHGGTIRAENHEKGAVFIVELPASSRASIPDL